MSGFLEVSCRCSPENEERLTAFITESVVNSLVTEDDQDQVVIKFYLPREPESEKLVRILSDFLTNEEMVLSTEDQPAISIRPIEEIDWIRSYQESFRPVELNDLVIRSSWDQRDYSGKLEIIIEPKMAFGTGKHETTRLCLEQLQHEVKPGDKLLDLGVGSAVLSILAVKLGASECYGLDTDPVAVENALENIELNGVADRIEIAEGSMELVSKNGYYDIVVSNLIKEGIVELFDDFLRCVKPGGLIILSGILTTQEAEMVELIRSKGQERIEVTRLNEWICCRVAV